jgi:hypothetical protein
MEEAIYKLTHSIWFHYKQFRKKTAQSSYLSYLRKQVSSMRKTIVRNRLEFC